MEPLKKVRIRAREADLTQDKVCGIIQNTFALQNYQIRVVQTPEQDFLIKFRGDGGKITKKYFTQQFGEVIEDIQENGGNPEEEDEEMGTPVEKKSHNGLDLSKFASDPVLHLLAQAYAKDQELSRAEMEQFFEGRKASDILPLITALESDVKKIKDETNALIAANKADSDTQAADYTREINKKIDEKLSAMETKLSKVESTVALMDTFVKGLVEYMAKSKT